MEITRMENLPVEVLEAVICDVCGRRVGSENVTEFNEMTRICSVGGYESIIGDGIRWSFDICQHCFVERLGQFIRREPGDCC